MNRKIERLFDEELLMKSREAKERFFENYTISHPKMRMALNDLKKEIYSGDYNIVLIVGPSGVGKSRLFDETLRSILIDMTKELEIDRSMIPISGIELPNPDLGKFNWKDFYYRALNALNEPLIKQKININIPGETFDNIRSTGTAPELRRSLENAFYYRKTKALLIDEAQHFFKIGTGKAVESQFNSIKSLANMGNTKFILFGTYDLNHVINIDGQLSRRVKEIHFSRYDYRDKNDIKFFRSLLYTFQKLLPVEEEPNLIQAHEYIYENCIGCAGILKNWLQRSLRYAFENEEKTITMENLKVNTLQTQKLLTLAEEAIAGELEFMEKEEDKEKLRLLLGIREKSEKTNSIQKTNRTPGVRKPNRDSVGL
ncbi:AAA family ATPase [Bacillus paranthracis]|uniref:AAA family ATPase n=1 Tax=Bacillus paranthracis TaxID=2026186 RepID=A0A5M9GQ00_9BACI|nr:MULTISPECIES: AAA family ATPase [Bacillus]EJP90930.1 hypothetical protein IAU_03674 [Bacillus cereus IS075]EJR05017.1 hypothetical protein II7_05469 [Bacillus cereus MSX-A12]EOO92297.1 hypothetical protein IGS_01179 [Bacillus cereus IS845/00]EOO98433.1 hypothetical protein IGQ_01186 [Bacillus cereus IS195]CKF64505.1 Archaeal ATPase [Streptococcus pneumoniae]